MPPVAPEALLISMPSVFTVTTKSDGRPASVAFESVAAIANQLRVSVEPATTAGFSIASTSVPLDSWKPTLSGTPM